MFKAFSLRKLRYFEGSKMQFTLIIFWSDARGAEKGIEEYKDTKDL